jgi:hypothetical protein
MCCTASSTLCLFIHAVGRDDTDALCFQSHLHCLDCFIGICSLVSGVHFFFFLFFMLNGKWLPDRRDFIRLPYISLLCFFFYSEEYDHSARDVLDSFESREHNRSPFVTKTKTLGPSCLLISFSHRAAKALMKYWPESFHNCFSFCA